MYQAPIFSDERGFIDTEIGAWHLYYISLFLDQMLVLEEAHIKVPFPS